MSFATDGVCVCEGIVVPATVLALREVPAFKSVGRPGARAFHVPPEVSRLVEPDGPLMRLASELMHAPMRAVRILYFDKTPAMNWAVPWHQDRTIAVADRLDIPGFVPWTRKAGVHHVEPPEAILSSIVSLRLHIDDCGPDNGPLMAVRGSFQLGRVPAHVIRQHVDCGEVAICCARAGDVVAMRGLTIHASERASRPGHRRVLHVDFSCADLPSGMEWALT